MFYSSPKFRNKITFLTGKIIFFFLIVLLFRVQTFANTQPSSFTVLQETNLQILVEWNAPELTWEYITIDGQQFVQPQLGHLPLNQIEGFPQLPIDSYTFSGVSVEKIVVLDSIWTEQKTNRFIPSPTWKYNLADSNVTAHYEMLPAGYSSNNLYPSSFVSYQNGKLNNQPLSRIAISPIKFLAPDRTHILHYLKLAIYKKNIAPIKSAGFNIDQKSTYGFIKMHSVQEGVFKITGQDVRNVGFDLKDIIPSTLKVLYKGKQVPSIVLGEEDGQFEEQDFVLYFAERLKGDSTYFHAYSDTNVYCLSWDGDSGLRFLEATEEWSVSNQIGKTLHTIHLEEDKEYYFGDRDADIHETTDVPGERWVWNKNMFPNSTFRTNFDMPGLLLENNVLLKLFFRGTTLSAVSPDHHAQISINGTAVGDFYFNDNEDVYQNLTIPAHLFSALNNTLEVLSIPIAGIELSKFYIDWFELEYTRKLITESGFIRFNNSSDSSFTVSGFVSDTIRIWDKTNGNIIVPTFVDQRHTVSYKIQSAGYSDGNYAFFTAQGERFFFGSRGISIVAFDGQSGEMLAAKGFDTYLSAEMSDSLAVFVGDLPNSTIVLAAVRDEASANLKTNAKAALANIGSSLIYELGPRDSWAIIGRKNAAVGSVPEELKRSGEGPVELAADILFPTGNEFYTVGFNAGPSIEKDFIVFEDQNILKPVKISKTTQLDLRSNQNGADYIIVTHPQFAEAAHNLANYRSSFNSFRTLVVTVQDIYDAFSFGIAEPIAIQHFIKYAVENWQQPAPQYLLLFGDASWDPKQNIINADKIDFVPTIGNPVSDALFGCLDGPDDILPDLNIGRIPVENSEQAFAIVDKIIAYESSPSSSWKKRFVFINGGFNHIEQSTFKQQSQLLVNDFIKPPPTSGTAQLINKESQGYQEGEKRQDILDAFHKGALWVNFIGHAGSRTWDLMFHNPDVEDLNNAPALPIITSMTCHTGRFAEPTQTSFGEKFLLTSENGAIGFWGTSGWGYTYEDYMYLRRLFPIVFQDTVHTIGTAITQSKIALWKSFGPIPHIRDLILQYNLLGDPALKLALPEQPDLVLTPSSISTNPLIPNEADSTATVKVVAENWGLTTPDSVDIELSVYHSKRGDLDLGPMVRFPPIGFRDSLNFVWPLADMAGLVKLEANLDPKDVISEADESNNLQSTQVNVLSNIISNFSPQRDAQIPSFKTLLKIQNPPGTEFQNNGVEFQIDTTDQFNSELLKSSGFVAPGVVTTSWDPGEVYPNHLYYWRVRTLDNQENDGWNNSWYYPTEGPYGWRQTDAKQFVQNERINVDVSKNSALLSHQITSFYVESAGYSDGNFARIIINGGPIVEPKRGINLIVYDGTLATIDTVALYDTYADATASDRLAALIDNVTSGKTVMAAIKDEGGRLLTDQAKQALQQIGSSYSFQIGPRDSWAIIGQKGAQIGSVPERLVKSGNGPAVVTDSLTTFVDSGSLSTIPIGPTTKWQELSYSAVIPDFTGLNVFVVGHNKHGENRDTLFQFPSSEIKEDISSIQASVYPYLSLGVNLSTQRKNVSPRLNEWAITFTPVPDLIVTPEIFTQSKDSVLVGEIVDLMLNVYNIGPVNVDSFTVDFDEFDATIGKVKFASHRTKHTIPPDSFFTMTQQYQSKNKQGLMQIFMTVDPDNNVPELEENNNSLSTLIYVRADSARPEIEITFDGLEIGYGELVSATPKIIAKILDNSAVPIIDTTKVSVLLDGNQMYFSQNEILKIVGGTTFENGIIELNPVLDDGEHLLEIFVTDASGNKAYQRVDFRVVSELALLQILNYPNPMQEETSFTFTLTQPADVEIKIYTVAGRLVRFLNVGFSTAGYNIVAWDGLDGDGDRMANGVYLYEATANDGKKRVKASNKLIIMR